MLSHSLNTVDQQRRLGIFVCRIALQAVRHKNKSQTAKSEDDLAQSQLHNQAARPMNLIRFLASAAPPAAQVGRAAAAYGRAGETEALPFSGSVPNAQRHVSHLTCQPSTTPMTHLLRHWLS